MNEENVLIDFHPNDYIIRLSPFLDEKGNWTGELMVGTISTEDNVMNDNDHYQLMHLTQMVCASIPAMEESEEVRQLLTDLVDDSMPNLSEDVEEEESKISSVDKNVISVKFHQGDSSMIVKVFLTLELDEDEYPMPVDGKINDEIQDAIQEFVYDVDGMSIKTIKTIVEQYEYE